MTGKDAEYIKELLNEDKDADDWEKLSNKEQEKVREMTANNWEDIKVRAFNFDPRTKNYRNSKTGVIVVRFKVDGEERETIMTALTCGYRYRNQKNKPWEKKQ